MNYLIKGFKDHFASYGITYAAVVAGAAINFRKEALVKTIAKGALMGCGVASILQCGISGLSSKVSDVTKSRKETLNDINTELAKAEGSLGLWTPDQNATDLKHVDRVRALANAALHVSEVKTKLCDLLNSEQPGKGNMLLMLAERAVEEAHNPPPEAARDRAADGPADRRAEPADRAADRPADRRAEPADLPANRPGDDRRVEGERGRGHRRRHHSRSSSSSRSPSPHHHHRSRHHTCHRSCRH